MTVPSLPEGYENQKRVHAARADCHITVGFDTERRYVPRFLVQLHYRTTTDAADWREIARMDHNETSAQGHDVYREGLHVDVHRQTDKTVHLSVPHDPLPGNRGIVIRRCGEYLRNESSYFIAVYEEDQDPGRPPHWSTDGGERAHRLISPNTVGNGMSQEPSGEDTLTFEELSEVLAEATDATPEEIERGAEELEIGRPWEGTVVEQ